jgi:UDP-N-acetylglucosamine--dolichyl-phosphate N-acetylglucosaminephosphotransferase
MIEIFASFLISFISCLFLTKIFIDLFYRNNIIALDLHKKDKPKVASSGGIPVMFSAFFGLMFFTAYQVFVHGTQENLVYLFAAILTMLLIGLVGFFDDLNSREVIEGKSEIRKGLKQWQKPLLTLLAAVPLMVVRAGNTSMTLPIFGSVDFGMLYPLVIVPVSVTVAANVINMLGGFNGSEAGMGSVYFFSLGVFAMALGKMVSAAIYFSMLGALLAFLKYNWPPAKMLSGDSIQYVMGAAVISGAILGDMERAAFIVLMPFFIEAFLKLRSGLKASCLGKLQKDGRLEPPYGKKIYSWTHIIMNLGRFTEKQVTIALILMEAMFCSLLFIYLYLII